MIEVEHLSSSGWQRVGPTSVPPAIDVTTTGWTATGSTGTLASTLSETVASDAEYVTSPTGPSGSVFEVKISNFSVPITKTGWSFSYRIRANSATSSTVVVGLYQGATLIASETRTNVPSTFTTYTMALTEAQATAITDGTDCRLRFTVTAS